VCVKVSHKGHKGFTRYTKHEADDPLMPQRSLIKEYDARRFSYGAFCFIDSLVLPVLREAADCKSALFVVPDAR